MAEYIYSADPIGEGQFQHTLVGELVRCGDCKFFNPHNMECEGIGKWFGLDNEWGANDFCSKAERRADDEID